MIHFPVLRDIRIENYQLYRNDNSSGIEHSLEGGVHLIVGINGLGKTTLLNAIYRLLVGPNDAPKGGEKSLGSSKNELTPWRRKKFFSSRVKDGALKATIEGKISFGDKSIKVKRKLSNLEVVGLSIDGEELDASQDMYEKTIEELSGLPSYVDFFSVVKFLIFFLEDRSDLIWDHMSQFEMFRILFFDREVAKASAKHRDDARSADSNYRNLLVSINKIKEQLEELTSDETDVTRQEYASALASLHGIEEQQRDLNEEFIEVEADADNSKLKIAKLKREFDEYKFGIEEKQHTLVSKHFPDLNDTVKILLSNLSAGGGCFVCGNESENISQTIKKALDNNCCPVCDSNENHQENSSKVIDNSELEEARLKKLQQESLLTLDSLELQQEILNDQLKNKAYLQELIAQISEERVKWLRKVQSIEKTLPEEGSSVEELAKQLRLLQGLLAQYNDTRRKETQAYKNALASQETNLHTKLELVKTKFEYYCSRLLVEKVMLRRDFIEGPLGQGGDEKVRLPFFKVYMTSGVHKESPELRESHEQVSESQREFIDLAFRLAIFDVVNGERNSPAMVVMETPEASLDSIFMHEISHLFRTFGEQNDGKNVFLASTNLNQSAMISSLLGIANEPVPLSQTRKDRIQGQPGKELKGNKHIPKLPQEDRDSHIINLLKLAAPNAALINHAEYYDTLFNNAVFPEQGS
ncbi:hypothetical protein SG34_021195 [Thalassomonas viridans]|uniref:Rad50/SbcC-type AAA domain-containing protein n=1 Tax=Thalassomonas viridans TaxID=137584 RepID=A0AAE9Z942_9GAMM|nr:hypothetical protein SG34_021195 [Thalassomonas viridans]